MIKTVRCKIVGMNNYSQTIEPQVTDEVFLKAEIDNKYDNQAVAVINSAGEKIGYVSTDKTTSQGNRQRGCVTNTELKKLCNPDDEDTYIALITRNRGWFGFMNVTVGEL